MKKIKLFEQFISEGYMDNFKEYENEFKKRGLDRHSEGWSEGGYEDMWYKDFELGRFVVSFWGLNMALTSDMSKTQRNKPEYEYNVYFEPFPKYKTKLFGLIKTQERQLGKQIDFGRGYIDFSEGKFTTDDKTFIKYLFKIVDDGLERSKDISRIEYLSFEDSKKWGRPAIDSIKK